MANREALRELQTRLASRLQTAKVEGLSISWLAVRAGGNNYLFPLAQSGEIFPLSDIQVVPYARPWFLGVVNLRGGLYGVVDLVAFIGKERASGRSEPLPGRPMSSPSIRHWRSIVHCWSMDWRACATWKRFRDPSRRRRRRPRISGVGTWMPVESSGRRSISSCCRSCLNS